MRQCPTPPGERALITHRIDIVTCESRQRGFYHKCHRCVFGRGEDVFVLPVQTAHQNGALNGVDRRNGSARNGAAERPTGLQPSSDRQTAVANGEPTPAVNGHPR